MNIGIIIAIALGSLLVGGGIGYFFIKNKKNKKTDEANKLVGQSEANDNDRKKVKDQIENRIEENNKLREELNKKLKGE